MILNVFLQTLSSWALGWGDAGLRRDLIFMQTGPKLEELDEICGRGDLGRNLPRVTVGSFDADEAPPERRLQNPDTHSSPEKQSQPVCESGLEKINVQFPNGLQGSCLAPSLATAGDPHWLGAPGQKEGVKRSISERLLGQRFPGRQSPPKVTPVPPQCHLAPVNSAVVVRQLHNTPSRCAMAVK